MNALEQLFSLKGRVALVTGANSGIGLALAEALASAGADVILVARRAAELEKAAAMIAGRGARAAFVPCDLTQRDQLNACARDAAKFFGAPDILVNAAGINLRQPMADIGEADWDQTMRINLDAPFFLSRQLAVAMIAKGWGRIVNIASLQSQRAFSNGAPYGASKGAIMQLTRAQAEAWSRHGVNVNAIAPGFFPTALTAPVFADTARAEAMAARTFIGRNGELDDLAGAAIFLSSQASCYVTGQTIFVDGGFSAG